MVKAGIRAFGLVLLFLGISAGADPLSPLDMAPNYFGLTPVESRIPFAHLYCQDLTTRHSGSDITVSIFANGQVKIMQQKKATQILSFPDKPSLKVIRY